MLKRYYWWWEPILHHHNWRHSSSYSNHGIHTCVELASWVWVSAASKFIQWMWDLCICMGHAGGALWCLWRSQNVKFIIVTYVLYMRLSILDHLHPGMDIEVLMFIFTYYSWSHQPQTWKLYLLIIRFVRQYSFVAYIWLDVVKARNHRTVYFWVTKLISVWYNT